MSNFRMFVRTYDMCVKRMEKSLGAISLLKGGARDEDDQSSRLQPMRREMRPYAPKQ